MIEQFKKEKMSEFKSHPALKFANSKIVLDAVRTGGDGYTGDESLTDWLQTAFDEIEEKVNENHIKMYRTLHDTARREAKSAPLGGRNTWRDYADGVKEIIKTLTNKD